MHRLMELFNQPYWTWENKWYYDSLKPIHKTENGGDVYYLLLPGFNKDNLTVTQSANMVSVEGRREGNGVGDDEVNLKFTVRNDSNINASIADGILRIEVRSVDKEVKQITLE